MLVLAQVYKWSAEDRWATAPAFIPWCTVSPRLNLCRYSEADLDSMSHPVSLALGRLVANAP